MGVFEAGRVLTAEGKSYIWLDSFPLEASEKRKLLAEAGSPTALVKKFSDHRETLIKFGKESVYNNMLASLSDGGGYFSERLNELQNRKITPIAYGSKEYPQELLSLKDAPLVLYAKGDLSLLKERKFTVVGARRTPQNALTLCETLTETLANEFAIVTGTADGGDSAAIKGALKKGRIVAVAAGGFSALPQGNHELLKRVEENGLLLSPVPYESTVKAYSYEYRNKLLAALSEGVLVVGAAEKSGALITAKYAREMEKKLFAFPYFAGVYAGEGCNALIKNGARLTETAADVFQAFGIAERKREREIPLSPDEQTLLTLLRETGEAHASELSSRSGIPVYKLTAVLSALEIKKLAVKTGGNRYAPL